MDRTGPLRAREEDTTPMLEPWWRGLSDEELTLRLEAAADDPAMVAELDTAKLVHERDTEEADQLIGQLLEAP